MPRPRNPSRPKGVRLVLNQAVQDYLDTIAGGGIYGNVWTDVAKKFIGDGIARAIKDGIIPPRKLEVTYETDKDENKG